MKFAQLVANGCSYMHAYAQGMGHQDLAKRLNIPQSASIAVSGSANNRIIRTTLKHSYQTHTPALYVLGLTFVSRDELPICHSADEFEGPWTNPQNQLHQSRWQHNWQQKDTDQYVELKLKWEVYSTADRIEDLQYRLTAMVADLHSRGHGAVVYNQADQMTDMNHARFDLLKATWAIDQLKWRAILWQHEQGVPAMIYGSNQIHQVPGNMQHRAVGHHDMVNEFLTNYIKQHIITQ